MHTIRYKSYIQGWTFVHVSASSCHPQGVTNTKWYLSNIIDYKNNARNKGKVKCTLVQALRLCTGRTAHSGSRGIALPFLDHGTRRGWGVSVTPRPLFTPRKRPGTHCTGGLVGPRAGLDRCGKSHLIGIRSPDRLTHSHSLHRLRYPAHNARNTQYKICIWS